MQDVYDSQKTNIYRRLTLPSCPQRLAVTNHSFSEDDLLGRGRCHYRTHDCEFFFESQHKVAAYAEGVQLLEGRWQLRGNVLTIKRHIERPDGFNERIKWTIVRAATGCLTINDGSSMAYTLQRLN
jgi:hypothetical protein